MDCRAASTDLFIDFFTEIDLPAVLSALGAALTLVMPVNHESDSVDQIQRLTDEFGRQCNYVVVRNAAHSDSFAMFESSEVRAQLKDKLGGREITMTRMQDWLVEALNARESDHHGGGETSRVQPARPATAPNLAAQTLR